MTFSPTKYQTKPRAVEAMRFDGGKENAAEVLLWINEKGGEGKWTDAFFDPPDYMNEATWHGERLTVVSAARYPTILPGHWLIYNEDDGSWATAHGEDFNKIYEIPPHVAVICPECVEGKHINCTGEGGFIDNHIVPCECSVTTHPRRTMFAD